MFERDNINNTSFDFNNDYNGDNGINYNDIDINMMQDDNMSMNMNGAYTSPCERPQERVVHRTIYHDEMHVCPIRTRIINHHIIRHFYRPCYSCCEENTVSNINCNSCEDFN